MKLFGLLVSHVIATIFGGVLFFSAQKFLPKAEQDLFEVVECQLMHTQTECELKITRASGEGAFRDLEVALGLLSPIPENGKWEGCHFAQPVGDRLAFSCHVPATPGGGVSPRAQELQHEAHLKRVMGERFYNLLTTGELS